VSTSPASSKTAIARSSGRYGRMASLPKPFFSSASNDEKASGLFLPSGKSMLEYPALLFQDNRVRQLLQRQHLDRDPPGGPSIHRERAPDAPDCRSCRVQSPPSTEKPDTWKTGRIGVSTHWEHFPPKPFRRAKETLPVETRSPAPSRKGTGLHACGRRTRGGLGTGKLSCRFELRR